MQCLPQLFVIYSYKYLMNIRDFNLNKNMCHLLPQCYSSAKPELVELAQWWIRPHCSFSYTTIILFDSSNSQRTRPFTSVSVLQMACKEAEDQQIAESFSCCFLGGTLFPAPQSQILIHLILLLFNNKHHLSKFLNKCRIHSSGVMYSIHWITGIKTHSFQ